MGKERMTPTFVDLERDQRLTSVENEIHSKGRVYVAEDVARRQLLVIAQRMINIQHAIEERSGETISLASLFESSSKKLRKGVTSGYRVVRLSAEALPGYLDERRAHFDKTVISATNPTKWLLQTC